ncbi:putative alpha,alpha-trehalose-phosphate synthase [UDP-forming] 9 [Gossypium australe]|uniref:Putative alpha,alpha-trehalose-phosphate synthase [UDP-forming] 9 n=1 Tax=Gossypium australe TaxID=47621 RepID=A0A5B6VCE9_9ROSI|nr:putative alpha,alpha-trehalose-phosphate synthase [UDP-forming] 9 [Gossypium australe]
MEPLVQAMVWAFHQAVSSNTASANHGLLLEQLSGVRGSDPTKDEYWLEGIEKMLEQMACSYHEKLGCIVSLLTKKAHRWWNIVKKVTVVNRLTWEFFLGTFKKKFKGEHYMEASKREFINLAQCKLSVVKYGAEFVQLS